MSELDGFIREVQIRAVTEDPDMGTCKWMAFDTLTDEFKHTPPGVIGRAFKRAVMDREQPLAHTMEVKGDAMTLIAEPDIVAFQAVYDDLDHE